MLKIENLKTSYKTKEVLKNINIEIKKGQILSILGRNGSGKTTLLKTILNIKDYQGSIKINNQDTKTMTQKTLSQYISYVPQSLSTNFNHTVLDIILTGYAPQIGFYQKPTKDQITKAKQTLKKLKIEKIQNQIYQSLSAGQKQMSLIARALVLESPIILMDEPLSNLDLGNQMRILDIIKNLQTQGKTIILTTHNPSIATILDSEIILLDKGTIIGKGKAKDTLNTQTLSQIYNYPLEIEIIQKNQKDYTLIYKK